jgi:hypothetical protein
MRKATIALATIAVLAVVLYSTGFMDGFTENFAAAREGHAWLPTCESQHGQDFAKHATDNSPVAKQGGITVVLVSDVKKVSASAEKVECTSTVLFSDNTHGTMDYIFTKEPSQRTGQYLVRARAVRADP